MSQRRLGCLLMGLGLCAVFVFIKSLNWKDASQLSLIANAASITGCFSLILAVLFFYLQERSARESSSNIAFRLETLSRKLKSEIDRLEKAVSILDRVDPNEALETLKGWLQPVDRTLIAFFWRSGYSAIPLFWARDIHASNEIVDRLCKCHDCNITLVGPEKATFKQFAHDAASVLYHRSQNHPKAAAWGVEHGDLASIERLMGDDYEEHKTRFRSVHGDKSLNEGLRRAKDSIGVNWAIAKFEDADKQWEFEMIVFFDKRPVEAVFLRNPEVRMTDNKAFVELVIQEFESDLPGDRRHTQ